MERVLQQRCADVREHIGSSLAKLNLPSSKVVILGASKQQSIESIVQLYQLGITHFGENFVQEAMPKITSTTETKITWHFIGKVQSNKTRLIATHFNWVQSIDRLNIAKRLDQARALQKIREPLNICIEVNVDNEPSKSGIPMEQVEAFMKSLQPFKHLQLRGLMAVPKVTSDPERMRVSFQKMKNLFERYRNPQNPRWDTLSMGMSADYPIAIEEGATMIRLGTVLFGART